MMETEEILENNRDFIVVYKEDETIKLNSEALI